ncbi:hypothetical protein ACKJU6_004745 [Enterobacter asburiae]
MSNIDKQALNQEKIEWLNKLADMEYCKSNPGHWLMSLKDTNMLAKLALRSVALLDELEAKDNRINRLEAIVAVAEQRNALMREWKRALKVPCDLVDDQVPVVIHGMVIRLDRLKETEAKLEAAEKWIAELEASHRNLREAMAGIHNTITGGGAYTPLAAILNASKRAYEESAAAAGKGEAS